MESSDLGALDIRSTSPETLNDIYGMHKKQKESLSSYQNTNKKKKELK